MKAFLVAVSIICFSYGAVSGASIHSLLEYEIAKAKTEEATMILIQLSPRALSEVSI
jgi:hypothetical protein